MQIPNCPHGIKTVKIINLWLFIIVFCCQIAGLRFVFLINQELISLIKAEAAKMNQQWSFCGGTAQILGQEKAAA